MTAGEYWRIASKAAELLADLEDSELERWVKPLQFLVHDAQRLAGAECVHEVAGDGEHARAERPMFPMHVNVNIKGQKADSQEVARFVTKAIVDEARRGAA